MFFARKHPVVYLSTLIGVLIAAVVSAQGPELVADLDDDDLSFRHTVIWSTAAGERIFVVADDHHSGRELARLENDKWLPITDLCPGSCSAFAPAVDDVDELARNLTVFDGDLYFTAGSEFIDNFRLDGLWKLTGAGSQAVKIADGIVRLPMTLGDRVIYNRQAEGLAYELWAWDGRSNTYIGSGVSATSRWISAGDRAFSFSESAPGRLFTTDGHSLTTLDVSGIIDGLYPLGERMIVSIRNGRDLWLSDGTAAGTRPLVESNDWRSYFTTAGGRVYFRMAGDGGSGHRLWSTDGSRQTALPTFCRTVCNSTFQQPVVTPSGLIYFIGEASSGEFATGLWRTDGSTQGTFALSSVGPPLDNAFPMVDYLASAGNQAYFIAELDDQRELWTSDGSIGGTRNVRDVPPDTRFVSSLEDRAVLLSRERDPIDGTVDAATVWTVGPSSGIQTLVSASQQGTSSFFGNAQALNGGQIWISMRRGSSTEFWLSDGTLAGTRSLDIPNKRSASSVPSDLTPLADQLYFTADSPAGNHLWRLSVGGTTPERLELGLPDQPRILGARGSQIFVVGRLSELWVTDGTEAGTRSLAQLGSSAGHWARLVTLGDRSLIFDASNGDLTIWTTDGTLSGTGVSAELTGVGSFDDFFIADHQVFLHNRSDATFIRSDGTTEGSYVIDPQVGAIYDRVLVDGVFYFSGQGEIWRSDGTTEGTKIAFERSEVPGLSDVDELLGTAGSIYFIDHEDSSQSRLWVGSGTAQSMRDLGTMSCGGCQTENPDAVSIGDVLYFLWSSFEGGQELWRASESQAPHQVKDICAGPCDSYITELTVIDDRLYFGASDGANGRELWTSDGTSAGTYRVGDIAPGARSSEPAEPTVFQDRIFFRASAPELGSELWSYDPADGGAAGYLADDRFELTARWTTRDGEGEARMVPFSNDTSFFWFFGADNVELVIKVLDGTPINGHYWVFYGALSDVEYQIDVRDRLTGEMKTYANVQGNICGRSDTSAFASGSPLQTAGSASPATPAGSIRSPDSLYTVARDAEQGNCVADDHRLCLLDGRFAVEVDWTDPEGVSGLGRRLEGTDESGYFWFFNPANVELAVKVLDGRAINGKFWVFYGSLSDVEYTLSVTDTESGASRTYVNPAGEICGNSDVEAF